MNHAGLHAALAAYRDVVPPLLRTTLVALYDRGEITVVVTPASQRQWHNEPLEQISVGALTPGAHVALAMAGFVRNDGRWRWAPNARCPAKIKNLRVDWWIGKDPSPTRLTYRKARQRGRWW